MNYIKLRNVKLESIYKYLLFLIVITLISSCRTSFKPEVKVLSDLPKSSSALLLTNCFSVDDKCEKSFDSSVKGILKSELQFQGIRTVIDKKQTNENYDKFSIDEKKKYLSKINAEAIVLTTINMLARETGGRWFIEVQVALKHGAKGDVVWVTKCKHESYWSEDNTWSVEEATRCAMKGLKSRIEKGNLNLKPRVKVQIKPQALVKAGKDYPIMLKIKSSEKISSDFRDGVEEVLTSLGYSLIDEKTQNTALKEQKEQLKSECYDDTCLVDTGKMLAAKGLIVVEVEKKDENSYKFKSRLVDFEKGTTVKSVSDYFEFSLKNYKEMMNFGRSLTKSLLNK